MSNPARTKSSSFNWGKVTPRMVVAIPAFPDRLKEGAPRKGFLGQKDYAVLAKNAKPLWLPSLIECGFTFGFRKSELLNLRVRKVDLIDRLIDLGAEDTKTGKPRKIPMTAQVFELMVACVRGKEPDDYVFTRDAGSQVVDPREEWYSLCVSSGLGKFEPAKRKNGKDYLKYVGLNLHDLRRTAVKAMIKAGIPERVCMSITGQTTRSTFDRYHIVAGDDLMAAAKSIEAGRQLEVSGPKTDTKSDTSTYAHS